ncbi:MAG: phosphohydrolase, partial [bacterium]
MKRYNDDTLAMAENALNLQEAERLSHRATLNSGGVRRRHEDRLQTDYRQAFSVDADRILHSH